MKAPCLGGQRGQALDGKLKTLRLTPSDRSIRNTLPRFAYGQHPGVLQVFIQFEFHRTAFGTDKSLASKN